VAVLPAFSTPANLPDANPDEWSQRVADLFGPRAAKFPQFYDPTQDDTPEDAQVASVVWPAFPGDLQGSDQERFEIADLHRGAQDEYCEWGLEKNEAGDITRVTFTTEVFEYFEHLFATDPAALLALYEELTGEDVQPGDLADGGAYNPRNKWNVLTKGRPVHLVQINNNLEAAIQLAADATILRVRNGQPVTSKQDLVDCGRFGEPLRNSDPQIASAVNNAAATGAEITFHDPVGLYIDGLTTGGMETPDGEDPSRFWKIERGDEGHAVRASYEVPAHENRGYVVGNITSNGQPIKRAGQLAFRVRVRLDAVVKPAHHAPQPQPCRG
jgi:hypothetical protein